jgi:hypothetical protein
VAQEKNELKTLCEKYSTVVYQMGHATEDMTELTQRTVVQPMKKLSSEFHSIQVSYLFIISGLKFLMVCILTVLSVAFFRSSVRWGF